MSSVSNRVIKLVRSLELRHGRDKHQAFLVEGTRAVDEVLASHSAVVLLVDDGLMHRENIRELCQRAYLTGVEVVRVETRLFESLCATQTPQGIMAVVKDIALPLEELLARGPSLIVISDGLQDPGNMGTLIRLADAVGAGAFVATTGSVDIYNPKVVRSTMGSLFHLLVSRDVPVSMLLEALVARNYSVVAADAHGLTDHFDYVFRLPLALVMGNEGSGLSSVWREKADLVRIPMPGRAESLNVGVAAGVLLYEIIRQLRR